MLLFSTAFALGLACANPERREAAEPEVAPRWPIVEGIPPEAASVGRIF